jgi:DnaJ-domain-containing protein 1
MPGARRVRPSTDASGQHESYAGPHDQSNQEAEQDLGPLAQYYANLEVPQGSDLDTVRRAWKRMMKRYHPDLHSGDPERVKLANELSAKLTEAYRALEENLNAG